ncbi:MAG: RNA polymerase sigma factor, partial [Archangium sp.]
VSMMLYLAPAHVASLTVQAGNNGLALLTIWVLRSLIMYRLGRFHIPFAFVGRGEPGNAQEATNAARDFGRRSKFEKVTDEGVLPDSEAEGGPEADPGLEKAVKHALAQLPEAMREAIVMHRFEGLSFAEIAEHAGVTESAVKVRAHRGYERLRELLKGVWP